MPRSLRILLTNHFPFHGSGTGTYTYDLAQGLRAAGHDVRALIVDAVAAGDEDFPVRRIVCRHGDAEADLPFDFPCFTSHPRSRQTFAALSDEHIAAYRDAIRAALDDEITAFDPDLIHAQHIWIMGHLALESGAPYVLTAQGTDLMGYRADARYRRWAEEAAENAGRVMAASDYIRREVAAIYGELDNRIVTVPSAVDIRPYRQSPLARPQALAALGLPADCGPVVAYSGKLAWFKGVDVLLEAATQYESRLPRVATVIAGDGDQRSALETQAARLGLKRVHFLGDRRQRDCAILYALADVVAMPSRGEPFGLVALEAMASGTPLVATASGGLNEIVNDAVGGLVPLDDSHALAAAIDRAVVENWKQVKGPAAARYVAEKHDAKTWISRIEAVYRDALRDRFGIAR